MADTFDVVIAGGGAAGLSAALVLSRCRRSVLVCDEGNQRNRASDAAHCLLGNEGIAPGDLLAKGRHELSAYGQAVLRTDKILSIARKGTAFAVECSSGYTAVARKVLLTTGLRDHLPDIENIEKFYGRSAHHCPYCDAYENSGKRIAVYGESDQGAGLALMMKQWTPDVILCATDVVSPDMRSRLGAQGIEIVYERIVRLDGDADGRLQRVVLEDGRELACDALFFTTGCSQQSDLWQELGCRRDEKGGIISDPVSEESSTAGVFVAGDASRDVLLLAVAIAEGAKAAVAINRALLKDAGLG